MASLLNMSGGSLLNYDAEIEYIESSGTQYIDTEVVLDSTYSIEIKIAPMENAQNVREHGVFGSSEGSNHNVLQIHNGAATGVDLYMPSTTLAAYKPTVIGTPQEWMINKNNDGVVLIDGAPSGYTRPNTKTNCHYSVYLFSRNIDGQRGNCALVRIYSFKVNDINTPIINLIPVRVGQTGYMYDKVSGQLFGNSGTGSFILGADKH